MQSIDENKIFLVYKNSIFLKQGRSKTQGLWKSTIIYKRPGNAKKEADGPPSTAQIKWK